MHRTRRLTPKLVSFSLGSCSFFLYTRSSLLLFVYQDVQYSSVHEQSIKKKTQQHSNNKICQPLKQWSFFQGTKGVDWFWIIQVCYIYWVLWAGGGAQEVIQVMGSGCKYRWNFTCVQLTFCSGTWLLTGQGLVLVHGLGVGDPFSKRHLRERDSVPWFNSQSIPRTFLKHG